MNGSKRLFTSIAALLLFASSCVNNTEPESIPRIEITGPEAPITEGVVFSLGVNIHNIDQFIWAISLRIDFDSTMITIDENQSGWVDDSWSINSLGFLEVGSSNIYITVTRFSPAFQTQMNGGLLTLEATALRSGETSLQFIPEQVFFYDTEGTIIPIPDLDLGGVQISID